MKRKAKPKNSERIEAGCPIPDTHRRLSGAHQLWHQAMKVYANPDAFRVNLNSAIQEFRNVTWILQKEHRKVPSFDTWYEPHQERLQKTDLMRWLVDARNTVVKHGDLETFSRAFISVVDGYLDRPNIPHDVPPTATATEIAAILSQSLGRSIPDTYLMVERRWEMDTLPGLEIMEALAECYSHLAEIIQDAHRATSHDYVEWNCPGARSFARLPPSSRVLPCMLAGRELRTSRVDLDTKERRHLTYRTASDGKKVLAEARKRFGSGDQYRDLMMGDYFSKARGYHQMARTIITNEPLSPNGVTLAQAVFLLRADKVVHQAMFVPTDRMDKYIFMREMASAVETFDADAIIMNAETWLYRAGASDEPKREAVQTSLVTADGKCLNIISLFSRTPEGVVLAPPAEDDNREGLNFFQPIYAVWVVRNAVRGQG
jgi:hypothetical protein